MSKEQEPTQPQSEQPSVTVPERESWTPPTLESLDVTETMSRIGTGTDGGLPTSTLS